MESLIKFLPAEALFALLPIIMTKLGTWLKNKDQNDTGSDDAFANILIAAAPAVVAYEAGNETAVKKILKSVYITLGGYLGYPPPQ